MKMQVRDRLSRGVTDVDTQIVAVGSMDLLDGPPGFCDDSYHLGSFLISSREP